MNILFVCGSRAWRDQQGLFARLDREAGSHTWEYDLVLTGGAPGADSLATAWAKTRGIAYREMRIERRRGENGYGRNQRMLEELLDYVEDGAHVTCLAFRVPGRSNGTDDMMGRLKRRGFQGLVVRSVDLRAEYEMWCEADFAPLSPELVQFLPRDEQCEHGLSAWLCTDPINHYPADA